MSAKSNRLPATKIKYAEPIGTIKRAVSEFSKQRPAPGKTNLTLSAFFSPRP